MEINYQIKSYFPANPKSSGRVMENEVEVEKKRSAIDSAETWLNPERTLCQ